MTANINPDTGIAYGYISAQCLHPEVVDELQFGSQASEPAYEEAKIDARKHLARTDQVQREAADSAGRAFDTLDEDDRYRLALQYINDNWDGSGWEQEFNDDWQPDEPVHEGKIVIPGYPPNPVHYRTSWLGGALHVWIFLSPFTTDKARRASPCVPNAGILDKLDGSVTAYDVPADWRSDFGEQVTGLPAGVSP